MFLFRDEDKLASDVSIGSCILRRDGILLLKEPAQLKLQLERNLDKGKKFVPAVTELR